MTAPSSVTSNPTLSPLTSDEEKLYAELKAALGPRIQVVSLLGRGGMALVFLGRDPLLKRSIAIKVLAPSYAGGDVARTRFTREAQAAATMTHPNVAAVYDVGELPSGIPYYLMQFVDGTNLGAVVDAEGMMSEARARRVIGEIASALAAAHARGIVHRDVKPANIIIDSESKRAVVVDFGISAAVDKGVFAGEGDAGGTLTAIGTYVGTPRYTSPEQAAHDAVSGKTDVYSLGVVAYEVLTGKVPFTDTSPMALLAAHIKDVPSPIRSKRPDIDSTFAALVDRCLLKDPAARPEAAEIASFLVPEPQAAIEWPPPGLDELRGLGARVVTAFNWLGVFAALFVIALATQPSRTTAAWQDFERSLSWSFIANLGAGQTDIGGTPDAGPAWLFVLMVSYAGLSVAFLVLVLRASRMGQSLRHGRRQHYPIEVLAAVALDTHDDSSALLNRSGAFAMLTGDAQRRLLVARRVALLALPAGFLLFLLMTLGWLTFASAPTAATELVSGSAAILLLAPIILAAIAVLDSRIREARLLGRSLWAEAPRVSSRKEFIRDWLDRIKDRAQVRVPPGALIAGIGGIVAGALVLFAFFVVMLASMTSARVVAANRGDSKEFWLANGHYAKESRFRQLLDSVIPALSAAQRTSSAEDTLATLQLAAATYAIAGQERFLPAGIPPYPPPVRTGFFDALSIDGRMPKTLQPDRVREWNQSPWIDILRRFARGSSMRPPYNHPKPEMLRHRRTGYQPISGLMPAIVRFTLLLDGRRTNEAREIAEDVTRAGMRFMRSPFPEEYDRGLVLAVAGLKMLREHAIAVGDGRRVARLTESSGVGMSTYRRRWDTGGRIAQLKIVWATMGDLSDDEKVRERLTDYRLHPYERWYLVRALTSAFCLNTREILFGINPRRLELHAFLEQQASPSSRLPEWVALGRERLNALMTDPEAELLKQDPGAAALRSAADVLGWVGMRDLRARIKFCAVMV